MDLFHKQLNLVSLEYQVSMKQKSITSLPKYKLKK